MNLTKCHVNTMPGKIRGILTLLLAKQRLAVKHGIGMFCGEMGHGGQTF